MLLHLMQTVKIIYHYSRFRAFQPAGCEEVAEYLEGGGWGLPFCHFGLFWRFFFILFFVDRPGILSLFFYNWDDLLPDSRRSTRGFVWFRLALVGMLICAAGLAWGRLVGALAKCF